MKFTLLTVALVCIYTWGVVPLLGVRRPIGTLVVILVLLVAVIRQLTEQTRWGVVFVHLLPACGWAALLTVPIVAVTFWARPSVLEALFQGRLALVFGAMFLWALGQQFSLQAVIFEEMSGKLSPARAIWASAAVFAALHLPNPFLTAVTFVAALGWCWIYSRHPNILPLAVSHAAGSLAIILTLDRSVTGGMRVGYSYFLL